MAHQDFQDCIDACNNCAAACDHCSTACLAEEDVKMMARCIALDMDCSQICRLAAAYMARGSDFAAALCRQTACHGPLPAVRAGVPPLCRRLPRHGRRGVSRRDTGRRMG